MSLTLLIAALAAAQAPDTSTPTLEVGQANWSQFDRLGTRLEVPTATMIGAVQGILRSRACPRLPQRTDRFDFTVNYAVRFDANNRAERIVVQEMGCRPLEELVSGIVRDMIRYRMVDVPSTGAARWYGNAINFNLAS